MPLIFFTGRVLRGDITGHWDTMDSGLTRGNRVSNSLRLLDVAGDRLAHLLSFLLHPIPVSTVLFWAFIIAGPEPAHFRRVWLVLSSLFCAALPLSCLLVLLFRGKIFDFLLWDRRQRTGPLLAGLICYVAGTVALFATGARRVVVVLMGCHAILAALAALINLRWKISLHAVGACGALVALYYCMGHRAAYLSPVAVAVAWARIRLGAHTPAQVLAGAGLGAFVTFLALEFWT